MTRDPYTNEQLRFERRMQHPGHAVFGPYNADPVVHRGDRIIGWIAAAGIAYIFVDAIVRAL